jgi:hypothetical protein
MVFERGANAPQRIVAVRVARVHVSTAAHQCALELGRVELRDERKRRGDQLFDRRRIGADRRASRRRRIRRRRQCADAKRERVEHTLETVDQKAAGARGLEGGSGLVVSPEQEECLDGANAHLAVQLRVGRARSDASGRTRGAGNHVRLSQHSVDEFNEINSK